MATRDGKLPEDGGFSFPVGIASIPSGSVPYPNNILSEQNRAPAGVVASTDKPVVQNMKPGAIDLAVMGKAKLNNKTLPYWTPDEVDQRLAENARLLEEWDRLLKITGMQHVFIYSILNIGIQVIKKCHFLYRVLSSLLWYGPKSPCGQRESTNHLHAGFEKTCDRGKMLKTMRESYLISYEKT